MEHPKKSLMTDNIPISALKEKTIDELSGCHRLVGWVSREKTKKCSLLPTRSATLVG